MDFKITRIPRVLPVLTINNVFFPFLVMPFVVTEERIKKMITYSYENDKIMAVFLQNETAREALNDKTNLEPDFQPFGAAAIILRMVRSQDGAITLLLQGISRIKFEKIIQDKPFPLAEIESIQEENDISPKVQAQKSVAIEFLKKIMTELDESNLDMIEGLNKISQNSRVADIIASNIPLTNHQKYEIMKTSNLEKRYKLLIDGESQLLQQFELENSIRDNVKLEMDKVQRRYYLLEQLDAIKKELGETDERDEEIIKWSQAIQKANLPDYVFEAANEEMDRLNFMSPDSSEYSVIRAYLDWLVNLPWEKYSKDRLDLAKIEAILEKDHYGLEKAKERILEFMAVKKLKKELKGPILCFVGPPGVGKTSIGKSVAKALKRKFIRISLGGTHDEAEIRGHRRTYIGAMPGKIISEIKRAGTANPVFMLDEIDKIGKDFRGDPSSALLEALDPEQNDKFMDNYLNLKFNLSETFFIATANGLDTIPPPLRDRMEIIEFSSYVENEKIVIARNYLIPREVENNGLTGKNIRFLKSALQEIIRYYIREAGVRNLQREIGSICRKVARKVAKGETKTFIVSSENVVDYLGIRKYSLELANRKPEIGVVTGLAWTVFGGEILFCEASKMQGKGRLTLTGLLGKVMKESAQIAISYIKSNLEIFGLKISEIENCDIHIHLPAGGVPKDGPSAGVTLTTALVSLLTNRKARHDIAMTGEITLLGKVLPIGGVREKILAAKRAGISKVILPDENRGQFDEIPFEIRKDMTAIFVSSIEEIVKIALTD